MIVDGFDLDSALVCEGIVGDGCGGGRIFYIKESQLFAYDPQSKTDIKLLDNLIDVQSISKKACIIKIVFKNSSMHLDLSKLQ